MAVQSARLEDRFRDAIGTPRGDAERDESIRFAVEFAGLLARILVDRDLAGPAPGALRAALSARTDLEPEHLDQLIAMALAPENRVMVSDDDLRAFGTRFGRAEEEALRAAIAEEIDLGRFAARYGEAEALLLLDSLFEVCAADGGIDRSEIARLTRAA